MIPKSFLTQVSASCPSQNQDTALKSTVQKQGKTGKLPTAFQIGNHRAGTTRYGNPNLYRQTQRIPHQPRFLNTKIIRDHPQPFREALNRLCQLTETPLLVISKSGGLRFECRTPGVYPSEKKTKESLPLGKNHHAHKDLYLEVFGEKGTLAIRRTV